MEVIFDSHFSPHLHCHVFPILHLKHVLFCSHTPVQTTPSQLWITAERTNYSLPRVPILSMLFSPWVPQALYSLDQELTVAPYFLKICLMLKTSTNHSQVHTWYFLASPTSPAASHFLVECLIPAPSISIPCSCHFPCNCSLTVAHASWYSG